MKWTNLTVKLSDLEPWDENPKSISRKHAKNLLDFWQQIGQFQTVAIGPDDNGKYSVYDGHQRLSVLLAAFGGDYEIDARVASRPLTNDERGELVIKAHTATVGQWDWDKLAAWDAGVLQEWGMNADTLADWQDNTLALTELLASGVNVEDDQLTEEMAQIRPREMFRVLISVPLDYAIDIKELTEKASKIKDCEIIYGAN